MGQGYSLTTLSAGSAGIDVPELADLTYEKSLGDARFMKAIRARHREGLVVAKVVMKPYASMKFNRYVKAIRRERKILADVPNALPYHRAFETTSNGYLIRQYVYSSIYDRMSTRPFLEDIEKRWLAFQLLSAVRDCHARSLYHGDIKTENMLVTSWNWLYLADFSSSFKPTYLPEDNPADFSFYFDISARRTCYLAPERFIQPGEKPEVGGEINWAMDIFSVGCVIAELFLESPIFSLSQLFNYRRHEYDPETHLSRIEDADVREMVSHMIQLEPESRYSADEYLNFWRRKAFPEYFYSFLHQYMYNITDPTSGRSPVTAGHANLGESDERIERVYYDFDKIAYFLDYSESASHRSSNPKKRTSLNNLIPVQIDIPNNRHVATAALRQNPDDGTLLFLSLVTSALRSTARATARIHACELLLAFAEKLTDEAKLDRVLPYVMSLVDNDVDIVKVAALRSLAQLLSLVSITSPLNAYLFPEYILPRLERITPLSGPKPIPLVRITYASCLATLAESASRFLDVTQALKSQGSLPSMDPEAEDGDAVHAIPQNLFDFARADLIRFFENQTKAFLTDQNPDVRRAFLGSVSSLCVFFGSAKANDVILSHLNTYLNDKDWKLKCAFFETIVGVATYVGGTSLEEFILPLMVQALTDPEETVVEKVLRSIATMAQLGLFQRSTTWQLIDLIIRFTMHPNAWIREAATHFLSSAVRFSSVADVQCVVRPLVDPFLRIPPKSFAETALLESLNDPLPRIVFDMAVTWASNVEKGVFWRAAQRRGFSPVGENNAPAVSVKELGTQSLARTAKNEEDQQWVGRLKAAGMNADHEFKLLALREYIWRTAQRRTKDEISPAISRLNAIVRLKDLDIMPQTVLFDQNDDLLDNGSQNDVVPDNDEKQSQTIADALLDASRNLEETERTAAKDISSNQQIRRNRRTSRNDVPASSASPRSSSPSPSIESSTSHIQAQISHLGQRHITRTSSRLEVEDRDIQSHSPSTATPSRSNARDLMQSRKLGNKANPDTSTSSTNAFGKVDGPYGRDTKQKSPFIMAQEEKRRNPDEIKYRAGYSYSGTDPNILKLLDSLYLEHYPVDTVDFGPLVTPVERRQWDRKPDIGSSKPWRPDGTLVAMFGEHTAAVNRVVIAPDHVFFITGSDDGTVKIWDSARLERNLAHRSRQTYKHPFGAKVTSMCFIENTHCFVSTYNDGSVHVVKIDFSESSQGTAKYGKLKLLRQWQIPSHSQKSDINGQSFPPPHAVWCEHFKSDTNSILLLATTDSCVHALDLRTTVLIYTLSNPPHHGTPKTFCIDSKRHWLLLGTAHGILDLWDLRFRLRLRSWGFPVASPIHRVTMHPVRGSKKRQVCVAGGTDGPDVTMWDLEKVACREVYRVVSVGGGTGSNSDGPTSIARDTLKPYTPWYPDSERAESMLNRFAGSLDRSDAPTTPSSMAATPRQPDRSIRALATASRHTSSWQSPRHALFIAAGSDRKVRFWDMDQVERSCVVSGLQGGEAQPSFSESNFGADMSLYTSVERSFSAEGKEDGRGRANVGKRREASGGGSGSGGAGGGGQKPPRSTVISLQQQQLLRSHLDAVMDVAVLEYPFDMIVSVDRSGVMYVFR